MGDRRYKICLLGEGRVGKTSILLRYVNNAFDDKQISTLTASCFDKTVPLGGGDSARVSIWDTAGQERFHALGPLYYRDADGALLVYDITDEASFTRVRDWVKELKKMLGEDIVIAIAGNKSDMEKSRNVRKEDALEYCKAVGATHYLTSAKSGAGVAEAFTELLKRIVSKRRGAAGGGGMGGGGGGAVGGAGSAGSGFGASGGATGGSGVAGGPTRPKLTIVDDEPKKGGGGGGCCGGGGTGGSR